MMFDSFNSNPFGSSNRSYYGNGRRREQEEYRRRMEEQLRERRKQLKAEYEMERRQRRASAAAAEAEERRWQAACKQREEMARRKKQQQQQQQMQRSMERRPTPFPSYPVGNVVRGSDGNLYRVVAPPTSDAARYRSDESMASSSSSEESASSMLACKELEIEDTSNHEPDDDDKGLEDILHYEQRDNKESEDALFDTNNQSTNRSSSDSSVPRLKQYQDMGEIFVVEDVPDSEDDELRELHSVWRNRKPSPGAWMEPIESLVDK